jgi:hypothetical protein
MERTRNEMSMRQHFTSLAVRRLLAVSAFVGVTLLIGTCATAPSRSAWKGGTTKHEETHEPPESLPTPPSGFRENIHGFLVPDPYRWLEDATDPDVRAWSEEQDARARAALSSLPGHSGFLRRLKELWYSESAYPPVEGGDRLFFRTKPAGVDRAVNNGAAIAGGHQRYSSI